MVILRYVLMLAMLSLLAMSHVFAKSPQNYYRSYWYPLYQGQRLDYCAPGANDCGKKVAIRYCQMLGYESSSQVIIDYNVGLTHYIDTRLRCKGWTCSGFKLIQCVSKMSHMPRQAYYYRLRKFAVPRYNHYRIDWCYKNGHGCGERAAFSFCRRKGFSGVQSFKEQKSVLATREIGDQKLCFGSACSGFSNIVCYR